MVFTLTLLKIASNFGLLDKFQVLGLEERDLGLEETALEKRHESDQKKAPWGRFKHAIEKLNKKAPKNTAYKVLYLARHGQGYHVGPRSPREEKFV